MVATLTDLRSYIGDDPSVGKLAFVFGCIVALGGVAPAEDTMEHLWPALPDDHSLSLEDQITDHLTELGNLVGEQMTFMSHDMIGLRVNGRANRAKLRFGAGNGHYLTFRFDSDWLFADGKARVNARVDFGVAGRMVHLELPAMDVIPDSYHGEQLVQVNVPLVERRF